MGDNLENVDAPQTYDPDYEWDVVYHGYFVAAKGADWLYEVAKYAPDVKFLYACGRNKRIPGPRDNMRFQPMSWETGLKDAVTKAKLTLVPSLWSASIEGALIKTILAAPQTGVVKSPTAFNAELDDDMLHRLSPDPATAAKEIQAIVKSPSGPSKKRRYEWWQEFSGSNKTILSNIIQAVDEHTGKSV